VPTDSDPLRRAGAPVDDGGRIDRRRRPPHRRPHPHPGVTAGGHRRPDTTVGEAPTREAAEVTGRRVPPAPGPGGRPADTGADGAARVETTVPVRVGDTDGIRALPLIVR